MEYGEGWVEYESCGSIEYSRFSSGSSSVSSSGYEGGSIEYEGVCSGYGGGSIESEEGFCTGYGGGGVEHRVTQIGNGGWEDLIGYGDVGGEYGGVVSCILIDDAEKLPSSLLTFVRADGLRIRFSFTSIM